MHCSMPLGMMAQQLKLPDGNGQQRTPLHEMAYEMADCMVALQTAAVSLLCCLKQRALRSSINELFDYLRQLTRQVNTCGCLC